MNIKKWIPIVCILILLFVICFIHSDSYAQFFGSLPSYASPYAVGPIGVPFGSVASGPLPYSSPTNTFSTANAFSATPPPTSLSSSSYTSTSSSMPFTSPTNPSFATTFSSPTPTSSFNTYTATPSFMPQASASFMPQASLPFMPQTSAPMTNSFSAAPSFVSQPAASNYTLGSPGFSNTSFSGLPAMSTQSNLPINTSFSSPSYSSPSYLSPATSNTSFSGSLYPASVSAPASSFPTANFGTTTRVSNFNTGSNPYAQSYPQQPYSQPYTQQPYGQTQNNPYAQPSYTTSNPNYQSSSGQGTSSNTQEGFNQGEVPIGAGEYFGSWYAWVKVKKSDEREKMVGNLTLTLHSIPGKELY